MMVDISLGKFIRAMEVDECDIIKDLVLNDGRFRLPPCSRTRKQKSAYVKYWRLKSNLSVDENGLLLYQGRKVLKKYEIKKCVSKTFKESKFAGYKTLSYYRKPISIETKVIIDWFLIKMMLKRKISNLTLGTIP